MAQSNIPYGNSYLFNTPKTDRLLPMLVQDQRAKDLQEQRNAQMLDQEFSRNVSAIRDIDVPAAYSKYQKYKAIGQQLYKNGNRMSDKERIALDMEKQRAASDYFSLTNGSKGLRSREDDAQKRVSKDIYKHDPESVDYLRASRGTPYDQHPDDIEERIALKTYDFTPIVAKSLGKQVLKNKATSDIKGEKMPQHIDTEYMGYNSPSEIVASVNEQIPDERRKTQFVNQHSYSDLAAQKIVSDYEKIKQTPEFKAAYPNQQEFTAEDLTDPYKRAVTLLAMEGTVLHPPIAKAGKAYSTPDELAGARDKEWDRRQKVGMDAWIRKNGITSAQKDARTLLNMAGNPKIGYPLDEIADNYSEPHDIKNAEGKVISTSTRVYEDRLAPAKLNRYNKHLKVNGYDTQEVEPFEDTKGRKYYDVIQNANGNKELLGKNGKIEADETRYREIGNIPANKSKQGIYFNNNGQSAQQPTQPKSKGKFDNL